MATEKAALDLSSCGMEACRIALDKTVDQFTEIVENVSKTAIRRRIRKAGDILLNGVTIEGLASKSKKSSK